MSSATLALGADYSQDELDALADAFGVRSLGSARLLSAARTELEAAVLRATLSTALRGLVARRAIALEGTETAPRVAFLEPHATLLGTFIGARRVLRIDVRSEGRLERRVFFVRDAVAVEQQALPARAILRMTAHPAGSLPALVLDPLELGEDVPDDARRPLELSLRALEGGSENLRALGAPPAAIDLVHARRRRVELVDTTIDGHRVVTTAGTWIDAGALGWWRVEPEGDPAVMARVVPVDAGDLRTGMSA